MTSKPPAAPIESLRFGEGDYFDQRGAEIAGPYRFRLWRHWGVGDRVLLWIMLNPSTADADLDDATIRRCISFSKREQFDGLRVCNLFAFRSTNPKALLTAADAIGNDRNDHTIREQAARSASVIAAWGCPPKKLAERADTVLFALRNFGHVVHCLGQTAEGFPRHPVRLANNTPVEVYRS